MYRHVVPTITTVYKPSPVQRDVFEYRAGPDGARYNVRSSGVVHQLQTYGSTRPTDQCETLQVKTSEGKATSALRYPLPVREGKVEVLKVSDKVITLKQPVSGMRSCRLTMSHAPCSSVARGASVSCKADDYSTMKW